MKPKNVVEQSHYEILNIVENARPEEVERAYLHITSIYSENSRACYGAISEDERKWMLRRIQEAYDALMNEAKAAGYDPEAAQRQHMHRRVGALATPISALKEAEISAGGESAQIHKGAGKTGQPHMTLSSGAITGSHLKNIRLARGSSLDEISAATKVKKAYLEAIECDDVKSFPAPVFMKGFLKAYAKALGLDPEEISSRYVIDNG